MILIKISHLVVNVNGSSHGLCNIQIYATLIPDFRAIVRSIILYRVRHDIGVNNLCYYAHDQKIYSFFFNIFNVTCY
jgi:hypothetical protein